MGLLSWLFGKRSADASNAPATDPVTDPAPSAPATIEPPVNQSPAAPVESLGQASPRVQRPYSPPPMTPERQRMADHYARERARAKASGRNVRQARAGYLGNEDAKTALQKLLDTGETNSLRLGRSANGLTVALPNRQLLDPGTLMLRKFGIYIARITGTSYYKAGDYARPDAMELGLMREPNNEHDANAVALTRGGKRPQKLGYVAKGQAKHVAKQLDDGADLVAHVLMGGKYVLIATPEIWKTLNKS